MKTSCSVTGRVQIKSAKTGLILAESKNLVVSTGLYVLAATIAQLSGYTGAKYCAIGTNSTTPTSGDTTLGTEVARNQVTYASAATGNVIIQTYFQAADCTYNITELGLFGGPNAFSTADSGEIIARVIANYNNSSSPVDLIVSWILTLTAGPTISLSRFEYLNTGDSGDNQMYVVGGDNQWLAEAFTPSISHTIYSVKLKLWKAGTPGTLTVSIRATSGGVPTGSDLCSGTTNGETLPAGSPYEWREVVLSPSYYLNSGTKYAIVARVTGNNADWRYGLSYSGGKLSYSSDAGSSWAAPSVLYSQLFEEWGY